MRNVQNSMQSATALKSALPPVESVSLHAPYLWSAQATSAFANSRKLDVHLKNANTGLNVEHFSGSGCAVVNQMGLFVARND